MYVHSYLLRVIRMSESQWLFSLDALDSTPSICSREKELYDRGRGVEFLFRLGVSLALSVPQELLFLIYNKSTETAELSLSRPTSAMCTAATWFHRFYMRYSMEDFHRQVCPLAALHPPFPFDITLQNKRTSQLLVFS